jgi:hypothetical protein
MVYDMESYLESCVERYVTLAKEVTGTTVKLKNVSTPFLVEDKSNSPQQSPCAKGEAVSCPWCKHSFPKDGMWSMHPDDLPHCPNASEQLTTGADGAYANAEQAADTAENHACCDSVSLDAVTGTGGTLPEVCIYADDEKPADGKKRKKKTPKPELAEGDRGQLASVAASVLMKVLYAARLARFDLLRATCRLACYISKWDKACDKRLVRLISYIQSTLHWRQVGYVGGSLKDTQPNVYADADLAGCADTQRSTTGVHLAMQGPNTDFPLTGISVRQGSTSSSTPEAEIVSAHHAVKKVRIPAMDLWEVVLPNGG